MCSEEAAHTFSDFVSNKQNGVVFGSSELNDFYTRTTHRVRRALFPEISIDDDLGVLNENDNSIVGCFAQPSQKLKCSILDLLSIKSQVDGSTNTVSQLISSLNNADPTVFARAIHDVYLHSKEDKFIAQIGNSDAIINALVKATRSLDGNVSHDAVAGLSRISHKGGAVCYKIFQTGGIPELIRMLSSSSVKIVHYAVTTLHNLLQYTEMAKEEIISYKGLEAFVPLLGTNEEKLQAMVSDSLYRLMQSNPQSKLTFLSLQGPQLLIRILRSTSYIYLLYAVVRCIRSLSACQQNKMVLASLGILESLHFVLKSIEDDKIKLCILTAMRNISDAATNLDTLSQLVTELINVVEFHNDEEVISCACGILSNLTCNNIINKKAICLAGGISILGKTLSRFINIEDITEPTLCTLRHCTVRHPLASQAQNEIHFAHQIILSLLVTGRPPIVKAALGLVRNCALLQVNLESIITKSINNETPLTMTVEILETTGLQLQDDFNGLLDGVSLVEMVEGAISALHQFAKDASASRYILSRASLLTIIANLMSYEQISNNDEELLMRELMGLIYQLSRSPKGAKAIVAHGFSKKIATARSSRHRSIAAYAKIIQRNMEASLENNYSSTNGYQAYNVNGGGVVRDPGWINDGMEPELYNELYNYPPSLAEMNNDDNNEKGNNTSWFDTDL